MTAPTENEVAALAGQSLGESPGPSRSGLLPFLQRHIRPRPGRTWTLHRHEYLRAIAEDQAQIIVVEKAAQLGASTLVIGEMLQLCLAGCKVGYFLDTRDRMQSFVQDRVDPIISSDEELSRRVVDVEWEPVGVRRRGKSADNVRLKHLGPGSMYFLTTGAMGEVKNVDLDCIVMDEVAELDASIAAFAQDRLLHSELKLQRWLSQPSIPELDIDEWFRLSDQKYWQLRCPRCRAWTALELAFPDCLIQVGRAGSQPAEWIIACPRCQARLIHDKRRPKGEWVAAHPGREISGYHLSQLYGPHLSAAEIAAQWRRAQSSSDQMRRFMISIVGIPWAGELQPITDDLLNARSGEWRLTATGRGDAPKGLPFAGIDQGDTLHLAIGRLADGVLRTIWLEETKSWEAVEKRLRDHGVSMFIIDAMPYKTEAKRLIRSLKSGAMVYSSAQRTIYNIEDRETDPIHTVNVDRTEYMDRVAHALGAGTLWLPQRFLPQTQRAKEHLKRFIREKRPDGSIAYRRNVENHYGMAIANMILAAEAQHALHLAPAGHFEIPMRGEPSRHVTGESLAPRRW